MLSVEIAIWGRFGESRGYVFRRHGGRSTVYREMSYQRRTVLTHTQIDEACFRDFYSFNATVTFGSLLKNETNVSSLFQRFKQFEVFVGKQSQ